MGVLATASCEQRHLVLLYHCLVISVDEYCLAILDLIH